MAFDSPAAKAQADPAIVLTVRASSPGSLRCFEVDALRQRIAHYGETRLSRASELQLELNVDALDGAELRVYRAGTQISRRRFEHLPEACADRRDAVALSIAMALEGVIRELDDAQAPIAEAPESTSTSPSTTRTNAAVGAASGTQAAAPEAALRPAAEPAAETAEPDADEREDEAEDEPLAADSPEDAESTPDIAPVNEAGATTPFVHLHLGARGLAHGSPSPVWVGALGAELWLTPHIGIDLSAIASSVGTSTLAGARAETQLAGGELLGCGAFGVGDFAAEGCVGASIATCRATGDYPMRYPSASLLWAASAVRLALRWPNDSWISLRIFLQGHVNLVRPELQVAGSSERLYPFWLGGSAGLDAVVSLE